MSNKWIDFLKSQVKPALGCTEPVAVALAVAHAKKISSGELKSLNVTVSPSIYKNGFNVTIPGTVQKGNRVAACLGWVAGKPELGLQVLRDVMDDDYKLAEQLIGKVNIILGTEHSGVYVEAVAETEDGVYKAIIKGKHDNLAFLEKNGEVLLDSYTQQSSNLLDISGATVSELFDIVMSFPEADLEFMLEGCELNMTMADEALAREDIPGVGQGIVKLIEKGKLKDNLANRIRIYTAAAADGRMGGINLPVMSSAGSGNHGITAILPIYLVASELGSTGQELVRALALSHLITSYVKAFTGSVTPVCGCAVAASTGATAGMTYLMGGGINEISHSINHILATLAGMVCDGAKAGCALKVSTAADEAYLAACLSCDGATFFPSGIVERKVEDSIRNMGITSVEGMEKMDSAVLSILTRDHAED